MILAIAPVGLLAGQALNGDIRAYKPVAVVVRGPQLLEQNALQGRRGLLVFRKDTEWQGNQ